MVFIKANSSHIASIMSLAPKLFDGHGYEELKLDMTEAVQNENAAVFLCFDGNIEVGFAQFSIRNDYVEGTRERPVGYVEGIYVNEPYRKMGIARHLIDMGEAWAKEKGCRQMASDCELANTNSLAFHLGCGFAEANRIICFVRDIGADESAHLV